MIRWRIGNQWSCWRDGAGLHVIIYNGLLAECEVLDNRGLCGSRTRTRTCKLVLEDQDFPRGQQDWCECSCVLSIGSISVTHEDPQLTAGTSTSDWTGDSISITHKSTVSDHISHCRDKAKSPQVISVWRQYGRTIINISSNAGASADKRLMPST